ncbi:hypothetical protein [Arthrobacter sp. NEB 688]|uniref:hypothetical protein n=1 Tax=Arthrobacter sp. NEB 688 TaxID=904039 RepID=UPI001565802B|nr:hypothetical protein [Arthrobacter sp. NEB 688]QKE84390.1 hypothetical protein HL663_10895 [Arthrobacter sp. NEB 688]
MASIGNPARPGSSSADAIATISWATDVTFGGLYPALTPLAGWRLNGDELGPMRDTHDARLEVAQAVFAEDADLEVTLERRSGSTFERQARSFLATEAVELDV